MLGVSEITVGRLRTRVAIASTSEICPHERPVSHRPTVPSGTRPAAFGQTELARRVTPAA